MRAPQRFSSDGVLPANEGRGYVLRKILRRGIRHGRLLGQEEPFMYRMVYAVRDEMQSAYPELKESAGRVAKVVRAEEERFGRTLALGSKQLDSAIERVRKDAGDRVPTLPGANAFHLYETYGLPLDFMVDAARDQGIAFDLTGFELARAKSRRVPAPPGKAERRLPPALRFAICRRPSSKATASSPRTTAKCSPS